MSTSVPCPTCAARVRIPDKLIGTGQPLLCPKCGANLFGRPPPAEEEAEEASAIESPPVRRGTPAPAKEVEVEEDRGRQSTVVHTSVVIQHPAHSGDFPHVLHLCLCVLTCGLWLPVWLVHYVVSGR